MAPDMNGGWMDGPEDEREALAQMEHLCGVRLLESRARIIRGAAMMARCRLLLDK